MKRIYNILPPDPTAAQQAREHWDSIAKPLGSLGLLEDAITRIAAIQNSPDVEIGKRAIVVMCADNGVIWGNLYGLKLLLGFCRSDSFRILFRL